MGSLYSKPKIPSVSTSVVTYAPTPVDTPSTASVDASATNSDSEKVASVVRKRSVPQTILTSFRGVLGQGDWVPSRKSLLGE